MKRLLLISLGSLTLASHAQIAEKSDSQLRAAIESHVWYSARHGYRFLSNGVIAVDGYPTDQRWSIHGGLLYRKWGNSHSDATKIIEINDGQLVEQEISGPYKGAVEIMYSQRPRARTEILSSTTLFAESRRQFSSLRLAIFVIRDCRRSSKV